MVVKYIADVEKNKLIEILKENKKLEDIVIDNLQDTEFDYITDITYPIQRFTRVEDAYHVYCEVDYNDKDEVEEFIEGLIQSQRDFGFISDAEFNSIKNGFRDINHFNEFRSMYTSLIIDCLTYWFTLEYKDNDKYFEELAEEIINSGNYNYIYLINSNTIVYE